jgi:hypothetical protein
LSDDRLTEEIRVLEERLLDPSVRASSEQLNQLLADDFLEIGSSGFQYDKAEVVEALTSEAGTPPEFAMSQFQARPLSPQLVLVTFRAVKRTGSSEQVKYSLRSSLWAQRSGRWQLVFHQGTPTTLGAGAAT